MDSHAWSEANNADALKDLVTNHGVIAQTLPTEIVTELKKLTEVVLAEKAAADPLAFRGLGGERLVGHLFDFIPGGVTADLIFMMAVIFVLGFFLEWIEISYIALPLFLPVFQNSGIDLTWLAILVAMNLQTSFLTPPFGWALFFLKGVAPPGVTTGGYLPGRDSVHPVADDRPGRRLRLPATGDMAAPGDRLVGADGASVLGVTAATDSGPTTSGRC